jgi:hypothetical protein
MLQQTFEALASLVRGFSFAPDRASGFDQRSRNTKYETRNTLVARMEIIENHIPVFGAADDRALNQIRVCADPSIRLR